MGDAVHWGACFGAALAAALVWTPLARKAALRFGLVDEPGERRIHAQPVPTGGGVAIYLAFWLAVALASPDAFRHGGLLVATTLIVLLGLADDAFDLRWHVKLLGQVAAAIAFAGFGGRIDFVTHPWTGQALHTGVWAVPLTVFWLVALTNIVNWIDGLDGLAAGVCAIASVPLLMVAIQLGRTEAAMLTAAIAGGALGFLPHNFYPARIIMGDTGAMFLGFALAAISVEGALKGPATMALVVPVLALGVPVFDTLFAVLRRMAARRPIYKADADHVHHRLLAMGLSHRQAVLALYALSAVMSVCAMLLFDAGPARSVGILSLVALGAVWLLYRVGGLRGLERSPIAKDL